MGQSNYSSHSKNIEEKKEIDINFSGYPDSNINQLPLHRRNNNQSVYKDQKSFIQFKDNNLNGVINLYASNSKKYIEKYEDILYTEQNNKLTQKTYQNNDVIKDFEVMDTTKILKLKSQEAKKPLHKKWMTLSQPLQSQRIRYIDKGKHYSPLREEALN